MLLDRLNEDLRAATKDRDQGRKLVLRWMLAECKNLRIEKGDDLTDDDVVTVLKRGLKSRAESVALYRQGGREDLAAAESREMEILRSYLPEQLTGAALKRVVEDAIAATGASSIKDLGVVMKEVMRGHGSRVDGKEVQGIVRACLEG